MSEKKEWGKNEIFELINMYHSKSELWDIKCLDYKDRVIKHASMREIEIKICNVFYIYNILNLKLFAHEHLKMDQADPKALMLYKL